jgi:hypothetical protein
VLNYLAPSDPRRAETMLVLYTGSQGALIALYTQRPGTH